MSDHSNIEWTDATWPVVVGCDRISPGCGKCYAVRDGWRLAHNPNEKVASVYRGLVERQGNGQLDWTGTVRCVEDRLDWPLKWSKPRRVFVCSQSDIFHEDVPDAFIAEVFGVMAVCGARTKDGPDTGRFGGKYSQERLWYDQKGPHTFQVLTKRPQRMHGLLTSPRFRQAIADAAYRRAHDQTDAGYLAHQIGAREEYARCYQPGGMWPLSNVWLGVSVENRDYLWRIDQLKDTPAAVRFVSFEPLLKDLGALLLDGIQWAIVGGESGSGARPCDLAWVRSIVQQCKAAGCACFVKQLGAQPISEHGDMDIPRRAAEGRPDRPAIGFRDRKGGDPSEWPEPFPREFPRVGGAA